MAGSFAACRSFTVVAAFCWLAGAARGDVYRLTSPDGSAHAELRLDAAGQLFYVAGTRERDVVAQGALGITVNGRDLGRLKRLSILRLRDETAGYPVRGAHALAKMDATRALYMLETIGGFNYGLQAVVCTDGFAWRFLVPGRGERKVDAERAGWRWPEGSRVWYASGEQSDGVWTNALAGELPGMAPAWQAELPLVVELPLAGYAAVMEAMPCGAPGEMRLRVGEDGAISGHLADEGGFKASGAIQTPWRAVMLSRNLDGLVNNDLLNHLAPPPDPALFDGDGWVKGGRSVRLRAGAGAAEKVRSGLAAAVDQAAELGFEYATVESDWGQADAAWATIKELSAYGKAKGVGVFVTRHAADLGTPEDDYAVLKGFLDKLRGAGAVGVKADFTGGRRADEAVLAGRLLHEAALRRLLVNLNVSRLPAGSARTYPNELTRGNISGGVSAAGNAALPFTRFLAGHAGYAAFDFSGPGETTWAHRLAMGALVTSPLMLAACDLRLLLEDRRLSAAAQFIRTLPTEWDETRVLDGSRIGEMAVLARRKGEVWHVAMVNGTRRKQIVTFSPRFTGWRLMRAIVFKDVPGCAAGMDFAEQPVAGDEVMMVSLEPCGGFAARLERAAEAF